MAFELNLDNNAESVLDAFRIPKSRQKELDRMISHACIDAKSYSETLQAMAEKCDTVEELVACVFFYGRAEAQHNG
jgi:hypothetical protein